VGKNIRWKQPEPAFAYGAFDKDDNHRKLDDGVDTFVILFEHERAPINGGFGQFKRWRWLLRGTIERTFWADRLTQITGKNSLRIKANVCSICNWYGDRDGWLHLGCRRGQGLAPFIFIDKSCYQPANTVSDSLYTLFFIGKQMDRLTCK